MPMLQCQGWITLAAGQPPPFPGADLTFEVIDRFDEGSLQSVIGRFRVEVGTRNLKQDRSTIRGNRIVLALKNNVSIRYDCLRLQPLELHLSKRLPNGSRIEITIMDYEADLLTALSKFRFHLCSLLFQICLSV